MSIIVSGTENKADASVRTWQDFITPTLELGDTIGEPEHAKAYISESKQEIVKKAKFLEPINQILNDLRWHNLLTATTLGCMPKTVCLIQR